MLHSSLYFKVWNRQSCFGKTNCIVFLLIVYIDISFIVTLIITELMADYLLTRAISLYPHYLFLCNRPVWIPINQVTVWFNCFRIFYLVFWISSHQWQNVNEWIGISSLLSETSLILNWPSSHLWRGVHRM